MNKQFYEMMNTYDELERQYVGLCKMMAKLKKQERIILGHLRKGDEIFAKMGEE